MFEIKLDINKNDMVKLNQMPKQTKEGLLKGMRQSMFAVERVVKRRMGRPGEIGVKSGRLRASIRSGISHSVSGVIGWVGSNLIYAKIHELGGIIRPRTKQYLKFQIEGKWKTVKQVIIPARPYLEPSMKESIDNIKNIITGSILKEVNK